MALTIEELTDITRQYTIADLIQIMKILRSPDGCPWDKVQTHESIKKSLIEESYETIDAIDSGDDKAFANELGDVLMQVIFHSQLADERGAFDFNDVVNEICVKLITRHTHVFGKDKAGNEAEALQTWEQNKKKEKNLDSYTAMLRDVPNYFPALMRAEKVQKKAASVGFDWDNINDVYAKVDEEEKEVREAESAGDISAVEEEYGDLLFAVVNLGRFLKADPELSLTAATKKFIDRFERVEQESRAQNRDLRDMDIVEMNKIWDEIKHKCRN